MKVQRVSDPEERRFEIVAAARKIFREKGLRHTTYGDIATELGITRGLVYHYFPTRDHLIDAALTEFTADVVDQVAKWDAARTEGNVREALRTAVGLLRRLVQSEDPFAEDLAHPDNSRAYAVFLDRVVEAVTTEIEASTVRDYAAAYGVEITHVHETFLVLIYGLIALLRAHPEVPDSVLFDITWNTLHLEEPREQPRSHTATPTTPDRAAAATER